MAKKVTEERISLNIKHTRSLMEVAAATEKGEKKKKGGAWRTYADLLNEKRKGKGGKNI